ncbi:MAG: hypothetical protein HRT66_04855 [Flavobacteriaceae bacterium]|nr:hypothetical protein [Flavobacteriaceae bacterium]
MKYLNKVLYGLILVISISCSKKIDKEPIVSVKLTVMEFNSISPSSVTVVVNIENIESDLELGLVVDTIENSI